ncbi:MAG: molecular chaperone HtpG [Candidatus Riflebacteria bacterium]|nr:molecular chaperone HtpG [Candidatus Riflebacteria bacterium]
MTTQATTFEFKTEAKELLDLMIHSVYSHKEIFLRELISNASDAIDKLRFEALTRDDLRRFTTDPHIRLETDVKERTLTISDNGIGMNRDEIIQYIGTIAKSGTKDFGKLLKEAKGKEFTPELIGQFGVGFYSSFMVADKVTLISRRAGDDKASKWESSGDGTYSVSDADRFEPGTTVTLHLKPIDKDEKDQEGAEDVQDFTTEWTIREIVRKYSDFVQYPIRMKTERKEIERDEKGKPKEGAVEKTVVEDQTLNSMKAIWVRPEKDVTESEYKEFYKHISHDWNDPMKWITYRAESATNEFKSLLYLPGKAGHELFMNEAQRGIHLYIKRVFIMSDCKDLIPEYLRFVKGVVDSEDLSLNISREILQQNRQIQNIRKAVTRKVLDTLKGIRQDDREKFAGFWKEFGRIVKEGLFKEPADREKLFEVCVFPSTASTTEMTTLDEYISRMKPDQKQIYYMTGESRQAIEASPHLEAFRDKGYEVLLLSDPIDEIWIQFVYDFEEKGMQSAAKGVADLGTEEERKKAEEDRKSKETTYKTMLECLKAKLTEHVKDVRLSSRLTSSVSCLVGDVQDMSPQMEQLLKATGKDVPKVKRILELNPKHPLLDKLQGIFDKNKDDERLSEYAGLLFGQAILAEGGKLPDPATFNKKLIELMVNAL